MRDMEVALEMRSVSGGKASHASPQPTNSKLHGGNFELEMESDQTEMYWPTTFIIVMLLKAICYTTPSLKLEALRVMSTEVFTSKMAKFELS